MSANLDRSGLRSSGVGCLDPPKFPLSVSLINVAFELFQWYLVVNSGIIW